MNERIKELAREAGLLVHNPEGVPTKLEKFAELIIKECSGVNYHSSFQDGEFHARELLDHFGVGE